MLLHNFILLVTNCNLDYLSILPLEGVFQVPSGLANAKISLVIFLLQPNKLIWYVSCYIVS